MRPSCAALLLGLLGAALGAAEDGGQAAAWSKAPLGARAAALGQAVSAMEDDPDAALLNPALVATQRSANIGSQAAFLPDGSQLHYLGMARPFWNESRFAWALAYAQYAVGEALERRRGNTGLPDSTFHESASLFQAGLGAWLWRDRVAAGFNVRVLSHALGDASAGGATGDVGLFWRALPSLGLGVAVRDAASRLAWSTDAVEGIPARLRASADARFLQGRLGLLAEFDGSQLQAARLRLGLEAWAWPQRLALRGGFDGALWTAGLGLRWPWRAFVGGLDYALLPDPAGGAFQHRYSLQLAVPL